MGNLDGVIICKYGNIVYEIVYFLGFFYEYSCLDCDDYVIVYWDNIEGGEYIVIFRVIKVSFLVFRWLIFVWYVS